MSDLIFEVVSATNYADKCLSIFRKSSRSIVGWESTEYAVVPVQILFKLEELTFVTEIYLHPKLHKTIRLLEIMVSDNQVAFDSVAKIHDFNEGVRIEISAKCKFIKLVVLEKDKGKAASIDFMRVYGHQYFKNSEPEVLYSEKKENVEKILTSFGLPLEEKWDVDDDTLITLHDMSKLKVNYISTNSKQLEALLKDFHTVLEIGSKIKSLKQQQKWVEAKRMYEKLKEIKNDVMCLEKRRDYFDEKYETSRFDEMIAMDEKFNQHDEIMKNLLEEDKRKLEEERLRREREAQDRQRQIDDQFDDLNKDDWWKKKHELDELVHDEKPIKKEEKKQQLDKSQFKFNNPYVFNQGDADMEKHIKPLINEFGNVLIEDPQILRKYEQLEFLDVLGSRIWTAAHSSNWRQRAAGVQAVLNFCQDSLPQRYQNGKTRNLFLALMQFARVNAEDKVLQIYYTSLKIMTVALARPICGDDVPANLINKSIQKFLKILIQKISEMNARAKQISLKTLIAIFNHPVTDITIAINECLRVCKQQLNVKFIPVEKQNPRIVQSRLEIVSKIMTDLPKQKTKNIVYDDILKLLIEGAIFHPQNDIRILAVSTLELIYQAYPQGTVEWYKGLTGLKPNISAQIETKLKIK